MSFPRNQGFIVIEEEEVSNVKDTEFNYLFYIVIAFVYAGFLITLVDRLLNSEKLEKECSWDRLLKHTGTEYTSANDKCKKMRKEFDNKKFIYLITAGLLSIAGGITAAHSNPSFCTGGAGVAVGGVFIVLYETLANWHDLRNDVKIIMLGLSLLALFYGSTRYYLY
jgi:hypothetical protein